MADVLTYLTEHPRLTRSQVRSIVGLNYYQAGDYIGFLIDGGFIAVDDSRKRGDTYRITPKGRELLAKVNELTELMGIEDKAEPPPRARNAT